MSGKTSAGDTGPLFVLATRLYVHYKFKARNSFSPEAALIDDDYALEVLAMVRRIKDKTLLEIADRFEAARFPEGLPAPKAAEPPKAHPSKEGPLLDLSLETGG